jgi:hypothetical protein
MNRLFAVTFLCAFSSAFGAGIRLDYVLNPTLFGLDPSEFGDSLSVSGERLAVHQRVGNGVVHIFEGSPATGFAKKYSIEAPDKTYQRATFGQSLGFRGDYLYVGSPLTDITAPHDGRAYLFNLQDGSLHAQWSEGPHASGAFGYIGGITGDILYVGQSESSGATPSKSGLFLYSITESGTRTLVLSLGQSETTVGSFPVVVTREHIFMKLSRENSPDQKLVVYRIARNAAGEFVDINLHATLTDPDLLRGGPFCMAQAGDLLAYGNAAYTQETVPCGAVFVYRLGPAGLTRMATLLPPDPATNAFFGATVAFSKGKLIVGSPGYNFSGSKRGCIYTYHLSANGAPSSVERFQPDSLAIGPDEVFGGVIAPTKDGVVVSSSGGFTWGGLSAIPDSHPRDNGVTEPNKGALYFLSFGPTASLIRAVKPSFSGLSVGARYQLELSPDLKLWTKEGAPFVATHEAMTYPQYWDVETWGSMHFRLQVVP